MGRKRKWNFNKTHSAATPSSADTEPNQEARRAQLLVPTPPTQQQDNAGEVEATAIEQLPPTPATVVVSPPPSPLASGRNPSDNDSDQESLRSDSDVNYMSDQPDVPDLPAYRTEPAPPSLQSLSASSGETWRQRLWRVAMTNHLLYCARGPIDYSFVKYLDAGELNVECVHCTALLFNLEAQQLNHDGGRYQFCCGKGKVTLPPLEVPPDNLMALFENTHPHSRIFMQKILQYNLQLALCGYVAKQLHYEQNFPYVYRWVADCHSNH
jgi:hypothetical protein